LMRAGAAALVVLASALPGTAAAQPKVVWKAADVHPLGYPTVEAIVRMGKKMEEATKGRITIQMYPSMQLGGEISLCQLRSEDERKTGGGLSGMQVL
ncbi:MAG TPA: hypothetical protein VFQ43_11990, partial [Nitrososphaera sp.]|nr:hypothetical protein [Nitrososphaera sp.]